MEACSQCAVSVAAILGVQEGTILCRERLYLTSGSSPQIYVAKSTLAEIHARFRAEVTPDSYEHAMNSI